MSLEVSGENGTREAETEPETEAETEPETEIQTESLSRSHPRMPGGLYAYQKKINNK